MDRGSRWAGCAAIIAVLTLCGAVIVGSDAHWTARRALARASAALARADYAAAVRTLLPAVAADPRNAKVHYVLGMAYEGLGLRGSARHHLEEAVRLGPTDPDYELALASALLDDDRVADALVRLHESIRRHPDSAALHLLLAAGLRRAGDRSAMRVEYRTAARLAFAAPLGEIARQELRAVEDRDVHPIDLPTQGGPDVEGLP